MRLGARDEPFVAFVAAYRIRLLGTASLIHLDPERAGVLVDAVLAQVYASWPRLDDPYAYALRAVVAPAATGVRFPGEAVRHFELVDVDGTPPPAGDDIRAELTALTEDERRVLVLASFARLPLPEIASLLDRDLTDVMTQLRAATDRLQSMTRRHDRRHLATELAAAAAAAVAASTPSVDPPQAGRSLLRHRRLRLVAVAAAIMVVAGLGVRQTVPLLTPTTTTGPQTAVPASPAPPCDVQDATCRATIVAAWRREMADLISSYLDPKGNYFTGYSYSYTEPGSAFWSGGGGALDLAMYHTTGGATEVYLQIATSRPYAIRCGQLTKRECRTLRFMDGNTFTMTDPGTMTQGLEVRHRPDTAVITLVARNTSKTGRELPVTRADLVSLIADKRLRLPPH